MVNFAMPEKASLRDSSKYFASSSAGSRSQKLAPVSMTKLSPEMVRFSILPPGVW